MGKMILCKIFPSLSFAKLFDSWVTLKYLIIHLPNTEHLLYAQWWNSWTSTQFLPLRSFQSGGEKQHIKQKIIGSDRKKIISGHLKK